MFRDLETMLDESERLDALVIATPNGFHCRQGLVHKTGRSEQVLAADSREWMDRGITAWARRLSQSRRYDAAAEVNRRIPQVVDAVYGR